MLFVNLAARIALLFTENVATESRSRTSAVFNVEANSWNCAAENDWKGNVSIAGRCSFRANTKSKLVKAGFVHSPARGHHFSRSCTAPSLERRQSPREKKDSTVTGGSRYADQKRQIGKAAHVSAKAIGCCGKVPTALISSTA
jgi:hypothetical protein